MNPASATRVAAPPAAPPNPGRRRLRVLIVEDDVAAARHMADDLTSFGLQVTTAHDGDAALAAGVGDGDGAFDVLILDRMLPGLDGLSVLQALRARGVETPALFVTAMGALADRVAGLDAGGDDYLVKPVDALELHARVQALARRSPRGAEPAALVCADLELDRFSRTARRGGETIVLLPLEYRLLEVLLLARGQPVTRKMLLEQVWGFRFDPRTNIVETHICRLRAKLEGPGRAPLIRTIRGAGYVLREP